MGDDPRAVLILYHYAHALLLNARYGEAVAMQQQTWSLASRLGDFKSKAYGLVGEMLVSTVTRSKPELDFDRLKKEAINAAAETQDAYVKNQVKLAVGFEEMFRGRMKSGAQFGSRTFGTWSTAKRPSIIWVGPLVAELHRSIVKFLRRGFGVQRAITGGRSRSSGSDHSLSHESNGNGAPSAS